MSLPPKAIHTEGPAEKPLVNALLNDEASIDPEAQAVEIAAIELENETNKAYLDRLAWLNQKVEITLLESTNEADLTQIVNFTINGKHFNLKRGVPTMVPRYLVEHIAMAKKEHWTFNAERMQDGNTAQRQTMTPIVKHPHLFSPGSAEEQAWYNNARRRHF